MAYASKYYDPQKAHEYYMKNRELKGYADRYGGWRGDGTSGASSNSISGLLGAKRQTSSGTVEVTEDTSGIVEVTEDTSRRTNTSGTVEVTEDKSYLNDSEQLSNKVNELLSNFDKERDDAIKKANDDTDKEMLSEVERLAADIKNRRESGEIIDNNKLKSQITSILGRTKKIKIKAQQKYTAEYQEKYKTAIEQLQKEIEDFNNKNRTQTNKKTSAKTTSKTKRKTGDTGTVEVYEA